MNKVEEIKKDIEKMRLLKARNSIEQYINIRCSLNYIIGRTKDDTDITKKDIMEILEWLLSNLT